jgi:hypothetical protein
MYGKNPWNKGLKTGIIPKSAFQKGFTPWNKGLKGVQLGYWLDKKRPLETRLKLSLSNKGRTSKNKTRKPKKCGWCGIIFEPPTALIKKGYGKFCSQRCYGDSITLNSGYKLTRNTEEYKKWRNSIFKRDNWTCQICEKRKYNMQVDHIKPVSYYPDLIMSDENARVLCHDCHKLTDSYGWKTRHFIK